MAHGYVEAWTHGDRARALDLIGPGATVEWNLALPADVPTLVDALTRLAAASTAVRLTGETYTADRAALVYDCTAPGGTVRTIEFLAVADGRIREIRQVYDVTALRRLLPGVLD
ncbi:hypothetical protein GCM10009682_01640 [Luedemannella flava]|uniref:SnoaL-like domain-containing protein n=1 Tax=Luedemannella flava TaxID=349316 RepID=A0ABN2LD54_9ACTN